MYSFLTLNILRLKLIPSIGNKTIFNLLNKFPELKEKAIDFDLIRTAFSTKQLQEFHKIKDQLDSIIDKLLQKLEKNNINIVTVFDEEYPESLQNIFDQPILIFYKGNLKYNYNLSIAVVGTRKSTRYGHDFCAKFCDELSKNNIAIVSGLALGIDTIAHTTALKNKGKCIGVLGGGFDHVYPPTNFHLYEKILENDGCLITEYFPNQIPDKRFFPARNRIISGIAKSTFVVEGAIKSGSIITANLAFEQGKDVYALPADLNRLNSQGCNDLIRKNIAKLVSDPNHILEDYGFIQNTSISNKTDKKINLDRNKMKIYEALSLESFTIDEILDKIPDFDFSSMMLYLSEMEIDGIIIRNEDDKWSLVIK